MKTLGPKFGARLKEVQTAILKADPKWLAAQVRAGQPFDLACPEGPATLDPTDVIVTTIAPADWAGAAERGTQVLIDCRITDELKREGMAREVIRHIQSARKDADLDMEDRIVLHLGTEAEELRRAIAAHRDYIGSETLTTEWASQPLGDGAYQASVKVDGQGLVVALRKAGAK
jgi:isoleucyl-tRNA synthetase